PQRANRPGPRKRQCASPQRRGLYAGPQEPDRGRRVALWRARGRFPLRARAERAAPLSGDARTTPARQKEADRGSGQGAPTPAAAGGRCGGHGAIRAAADSAACFPRRGMIMPERYRQYFPAALGVAGLVFLYLTFFSVRETEFLLVTQFGRPVYTVTYAGLHVKSFFQTATWFDRRLRVYNPRPSEFLTRDKKNLVIENYVVWQIRDPKRFVETVGDPTAAEMRLHDIIWSGLSAALGSHDLESIVSA